MVFDGGNGEVTGVRDGSTTPTEPPPGVCTATRDTTGGWSGGYQSQVTVTNSGDVPMLGWMVEWTQPVGQSVASLWSGAMTTRGQEVMVHNADWNGSLDPGESTTFGYVSAGGDPDPGPAPECTVG